MHMQIAQKRIRKTIAFPSQVLQALNEKAGILGLSVVDYIRFLALKDAEKQSPHLSVWAEQEIKESIKEIENEEVSPAFSKAKDAMKWLKS